MEMETPIGNERPNRGLGPHAHDPRTFSVARRVVEIVAVAVPGAAAEHVGSSSVAGLPGKNVVDVLLPLDAAEISDATERLVAVGFQRQNGRDPFPPTRPMLEGSLREDGDVFAIHLHVIPLGDPEIEEMRAFRDRLRSDAALRDAYVAEKQRIVDRGVPDALEYAYEKGVFVVSTLREMGFPVERNTLRPGTN
jgi:dephospho-CoA kinase